jgi:hypothetical protein
MAARAMDGRVAAVDESDAIPVYSTPFFVVFQRTPTPSLALFLVTNNTDANKPMEQ